VSPAVTLLGAEIVSLVAGSATTVVEAVAAVRPLAVALKETLPATVSGIVPLKVAEPLTREAVPRVVPPVLSVTVLVVLGSTLSPASRARTVTVTLLPAGTVSGALRESLVAVDADLTKVKSPVLDNWKVPRRVAGPPLVLG
jgi:hypothetical protein